MGYGVLSPNKWDLEAALAGLKKPPTVTVRYQNCHFEDNPPPIISPKILTGGGTEKWPKAFKKGLRPPYIPLQELDFKAL